MTNIVFLPNLDNKIEVKKVQRTCRRLISEGKIEAIYPESDFLAISEPYNTTALIPDSCCMMARCKDIIMATFVSLTLVYAGVSDTTDYC